MPMTKKEINRRWYLKNHEKNIQRSREKYLKNKDAHSLRVKNWQSKNQELIKEKRKEYLGLNKEKTNKTRREFYQKHIEEHRERDRERYQHHRSEISVRRSIRYHEKKIQSLYTESESWRKSFYEDLWESENNRIKKNRISNALWLKKKIRTNIPSRRTKALLNGSVMGYETCSMQELRNIMDS